MKLRRLLKEKLARGHVEITLSIDRTDGDGFKLNRELVGGYIQAFRAAADEFGLMAEPDLNVVLRMPGAMEAAIPQRRRTRIRRPGAGRSRPLRI